LIGIARPDIALAELSESNGAGSLERAAAKYPRPGVIIPSMHRSDCSGLNRKVFLRVGQEFSDGTNSKKVYRGNGEKAEAQQALRRSYFGPKTPPRLDSPAL